MSALSSILRSIEGGRVGFWCPGCDQSHVIVVMGANAWGYNGDPDSPTFSPSILIRSGHFVPGNDGGCWCKYNTDKIAAGKQPAPFECRVCHSFVNAGQIQFLNDCTHALAGQTVPIPAWPSGDAL